MRKTAGEIAQAIEGEVIGDKNALITGIAGIKEAGPGDITFLANPKYAPLLNTTAASAIIISKDTEAPSSKTVIRCKNPSLAFAKVISLFTPLETKLQAGVHIDQAEQEHPYPEPDERSKKVIKKTWSWSFYIFKQ